MKTSITMMLAFLAASNLFLSSCADDPVIPNEEELITTLIWTFSPVGGGTDVEFRFTDLDGDGGSAPVIVNDTLDANANYTTALRLLNESVSPGEEITVEIEAEGVDHQFFFASLGGVNLNLSYSDSDINGFPIGLSLLGATGDPSNGMVTITLRHEPIKTATGVNNGDITNAGGETDIEVTFDVTVQ